MGMFLKAVWGHFKAVIVYPLSIHCWDWYSWKLLEGMVLITVVKMYNVFVLFSSNYVSCEPGLIMLEQVSNLVGNSTSSLNGKKLIWSSIYCTRWGVLKVLNELVQYIFLRYYSLCLHFRTMYFYSRYAQFFFFLIYVPWSVCDLHTNYSKWVLYRKY